MEVFRRKVRDHFKGFYVTNDLAHLICHADEVVDNALYIVRELGMLEWEELAIVAGYGHDMFADQREDHHHLAAAYLRSNDFKFYKFLGKDPQPYEWVAEAARSHRASWKGEYTNLFAEVIAVADRGRPCLKSYYVRSYLYGISKLGYGRDEAVLHSHKHIKEKFGHGGVAKFPELYSKIYADELKDARDRIENISVLEVNDLIRCNVEDAW